MRSFVRNLTELLVIRQRWRRFVLGASAVANVIAVLIVATLLIADRASSSPEPFPPSSIPVSEAVRVIDAPTGTTANGFYYMGRSDAPVTVVEYIDLQCPSCAAVFFQWGELLIEEYIEPGAVQLIARDLPLRMHPNAVPASVAARCAGGQGHFWEMHDLLLTRQNEWSSDPNLRPRVVRYSKDLGLDTSEFERCFDNQEMHANVHERGEQARIDGVNSTPTFLVDGNEIETLGLIDLIDSALRASESNTSD